MSIKIYTELMKIHVGSQGSKIPKIPMIFGPKIGVFSRVVWMGRKQAIFRDFWAKKWLL